MFKADLIYNQIDALYFYIDFEIAQAIRNSILKKILVESVCGRTRRFS